MTTIDNETDDLLRRSGIPRRIAVPAQALNESFTKSDVELLKRYIVRFVQNHERQTAVLERIAKALERKQGERRHGR